MKLASAIVVLLSAALLAACDSTKSDDIGPENPGKPRAPESATPAATTQPTAQPTANAATAPAPVSAPTQPPAPAAPALLNKLADALPTSDRVGEPRFGVWVSNAFAPAGEGYSAVSRSYHTDVARIVADGGADKPPREGTLKRPRSSTLTLVSTGRDTSWARQQLVAHYTAKGWTPEKRTLILAGKGPSTGAVLDTDIQELSESVDCFKQGDFSVAIANSESTLLVGESREKDGLGYSMQLITLYAAATRK